MTKIGQAALTAEKKTTKNIADLEKVSVDIELEARTYKEGTPEEYSIEVVVVNGEEYRVPPSVLIMLKQAMTKFPQMKEFSVMKTGKGINDTRYNVIPMGV